MHLSERTSLPSGDGGTINTFGVLNGDLSIARKNSIEIIGVAQYTESPKYDVSSKMPTPPRLLHECDSKILEAALENLDRVDSKSCLSYHSEPHDLDVALVRSIDAENRELLFLFAITNGKIDQVKFDDQLLTSQGALILSDPNAENDIAPQSSTIIYLPDLNRNGFPEIVVKATVSLLFDIGYEDSSGVSVSLIRSAYFGP